MYQTYKRRLLNWHAQHIYDMLVHGVGRWSVVAKSAGRCRRLWLRPSVVIADVSGRVFTGAHVDARQHGQSCLWYTQSVTQHGVDYAIAQHTWSSARHSEARRRWLLHDISRRRDRRSVSDQTWWQRSRLIMLIINIRREHKKYPPLRLLLIFQRCVQVFTWNLRAKICTHRWNNKASTKVAGGAICAPCTCTGHLFVTVCVTHDITVILQPSVDTSILPADAMLPIITSVVAAALLLKHLTTDKLLFYVMLF